MPGSKYVCDFTVFWADGEVSFIDVKGRDTPLSKTKRRMVEKMFPVEIEVVSKISHFKAIS